MLINTQYALSNFKDIRKALKKAFNKELTEKIESALPIHYSCTGKFIAVVDSSNGPVINVYSDFLELIAVLPCYGEALETSLQQMHSPIAVSPLSNFTRMGMCVDSLEVLQLIKFLSTLTIVTPVGEQDPLCFRILMDRIALMTTTALGVDDPADALKIAMFSLELLYNNVPVTYWLDVNTDNNLVIGVIVNKTGKRTSMSLPCKLNKHGLITLVVDPTQE